MGKGFAPAEVGVMGLLGPQIEHSRPQVSYELGHLD